MDRTERQFGCKSVTYVPLRSLVSESTSDEGRPRFKNCLSYFITTIPPGSDPILSLATFGRNMVYAGTEKGNIQILNMESCGTVQVKNVRCENESVKSFVFAGNKVYSAHRDQKIRVWQRPTRLPMSLKLWTTMPTMREHLKNIFRSDNYVEIRRHHKSPWFKHFDAIACLAIGFDDDLLYSGSWDKTVKVWRLRDFVCLESIKAHNDAVNGIAVSRHGMLFTASADGTVKGWKREAVRENDRCHHKLVIQLKQAKDIPASSVNAITLSSDQSVLYSGTSTSQINFWTSHEESLEIMSYKGTLRGHERSVLCLKSLGKLLCSGSADKTIRIWKREFVSRNETHHVCLLLLEGHNSPVKCVAAAVPAWTIYSSSLSPRSSSTSSLCSYQDSNSAATNVDAGSADNEGRHSDSQLFTLYSGSLDGSLRVWCINNNAIRSEICSSYSFN